MRAGRIKRWMIGGAVGTVMLFGGSASAGNYPPRDTPVTTAAVGGVSGIVAPAAPTAVASASGSATVAGELPATGSDSDSTLKLAGGAIVAGGGLLVAAKLRRRPASS